MTTSQLMCDKIRQVMKERKMTRQDLADKTGLSIDTIYRYLNDKKPIHKYDTLKAVCKALDVSADFLLGINDDSD